MEHSEKRRYPRDNRHGENNPRCRVSDHDAMLMVRLREDFGLSPRQILAKFDNYDPPLSLTTVKDILSGRRRGMLLATLKPGADV